MNSKKRCGKIETKEDERRFEITTSCRRRIHEAQSPYVNKHRKDRKDSLAYCQLTMREMQIRVSSRSERQGMKHSQVDGVATSRNIVEMKFEYAKGDGRLMKR